MSENNKWNNWQYKYLKPIANSYTYKESLKFSTPQEMWNECNSIGSMLCLLRTLHRWGVLNFSRMLLYSFYWEVFDYAVPKWRQEFAETDCLDPTLLMEKIKQYSAEKDTTLIDSEWIHRELETFKSRCFDSERYHVKRKFFKSFFRNLRSVLNLITYESCDNLPHISRAMGDNDIDARLWRIRCLKRYFPDPTIYLVDGKDTWIIIERVRMWKALEKKLYYLPLSSGTYRRWLRYESPQEAWNNWTNVNEMICLLIRARVNGKALAAFYIEAFEIKFSEWRQMFNQYMPTYKELADCCVRSVREYSQGVIDINKMCVIYNELAQCGYRYCSSKEFESDSFFFSSFYGNLHYLLLFITDYRPGLWKFLECYHKDNESDEDYYKREAAERQKTLDCLRRHFPDPLIYTKLR